MRLKLLTPLIMITTQLSAEVRMNSLWRDSVVLQRNEKILIAGESNKMSVKVTTSWNDESYFAPVTRNQQWGVEIQTCDTGGPYTITIDDGEKLIINNVMLGDLCDSTCDLIPPFWSTEWDVK